jgi:hypothetical protein
MRKLIIFAFALMMCACKTHEKIVTVEKVTHDTLWHEKTERDSIYLHDSIFVNQFAKGDTIFQVKDRWHTEYRDKYIHDTISIAKVDSIPVPYEVQVEVEKKLSWLQKLLIALGGIFSVSVLTIVGLKIYRFVR